MTAPEPISWLVDDRHTGKTTALMAWLVEGEAGHHGRSWSRVVLTQSEEEVERLIRSYPGVEILVRRAGYVGSMRTLIASVTHSVAARSSRLSIWRDTEFAVDDVDSLLTRVIGVHPSVVTASGLVMHSDRVSAEEYDDLTTRRLQPHIEPEPAPEPTALVMRNRPNGTLFTIKTMDADLLLRTLNGLPGVTALHEASSSKDLGLVTVKIMGDQRFAEHAIREQGYCEIVEVSDVT